jgi:hypothetical protein
MDSRMKKYLAVILLLAANVRSEVPAQNPAVNSAVNPTVNEGVKDSANNTAKENALKALTAELQKKSAKNPINPENLLKKSLEIFANDPDVKFSELKIFWKDLRSEVDSLFLEKRIDAFLSRATRFDELALNPSKTRMFVLLDALKLEFPKKPYGTGYDHDRYASFQILGAFAERENLKTSGDTDCLYIEGSSYAWIRMGGDLQLEEAIKVSKGRSAWSKPALAEFEDYISYVNRGRIPDDEKARISGLKKIF